MTDRIYVVGDIHGDLAKLRQIHSRIEDDQKELSPAPIVHVGDLVDRRANSKGVLDYLIDGIEGGQPWVVLKGNHDRLFYKFLTEANWKDPILRSDYSWIHSNMGGLTTLQSYGVDISGEPTLASLRKQADRLVPDRHRNFLGSLPLYHLAGNNLIVHAGIRPAVALEEQTEDDLIWIRRDFHEYTAPHPYLIVHGHSVIDEVTHYGNRVNIDTGAAYGRNLSAIVIEGGQILVLDENGRRRLLPPD